MINLNIKFVYIMLIIGFIIILVYNKDNKNFKLSIESKNMVSSKSPEMIAEITTKL